MWGKLKLDRIKICKECWNVVRLLTLTLFQDILRSLDICREFGDDANAWGKSTREKQLT